MRDDVEVTFTPSSGNVFADLGLSDPDLLLAKAEIAIAIAAIVRERGLTQTAVAREHGVHQSRVSAITRGRLDDVSLDRLMAFARRLGHDIEITLTVSPIPSPPTPGSVQTLQPSLPFAPSSAAARARRVILGANISDRRSATREPRPHSQPTTRR